MDRHMISWSGEVFLDGTWCRGANQPRNRLSMDVILKCSNFVLIKVWLMKFYIFILHYYRTKTIIILTEVKHGLQNRHLGKLVIRQHWIGVESVPFSIVVNWPIDAVLKYSIGYSTSKEHNKPWDSVVFRLIIWCSQFQRCVLTKS